MKNIIEFKSGTGTEYIFDSRYNITYLKERLYDENFQLNLKRINKKKVFNSKYDINELSNLTEVDLKRYIYKNGLKELLLEVTTGCNMRCKYCVFSDNYIYNRSHGNKLLSYKQGRASIEMYLELCDEAKEYNPTIKPMIGFYGGEPLLNYKVIKKLITFVRKIDKFNDVEFTITTNGLLMDEEKIDFFIKNNVIVIFSLDGPKQEHDKRRVDITGRGTFNRVIKNIKLYADKKGYAFTNSVYSPDSDLEGISRFFDVNPKISSIGFSPVNDNGTEYYDNFTAEDINNFNKLVESLFNNVSLETDFNNPEMGRFLFNWILKSSSTVMTRIPFNRKSGLIQYTGGCVPGDKMFINIDGDILICEKLNNAYKIGNIDKGFDYSTILKIIKNYNKSTEKCKYCAYNNLCSICLATCGQDGNLLLTSERCKIEKNAIKKRLEIAYTVLEKNDNWFELFNIDYQKKMRSIEGEVF